MIIRGNINDADTNLGIPGASVQLLNSDGTATGIGVASDNGGFFSFDDNGQSDPTSVLSFSSIGYISTKAPLKGFSGVIVLKKNVIDETGVTVTSTPASSNLGLLLLGAGGLFLFMNDKKKKKVGAITVQEEIVVGVALAGIFAWKALKAFLCKLNIFPGDCSGADTCKSDPNCAFNPDFWQRNAKTDQIAAMEADQASYIQGAQGIYDSFTLLSDDYSYVQTVFNNMNKQIMVSYLSYVFESLYNKSFLDYLQNGEGLEPLDGLSNAHLKTIMDYVKALPVN